VKYVKTGVQDDQFIHIMNGLTKDDQVITGPYDEVAKNLNNGDEVSIGDIEMKSEK
jgi:HlyD family secretion protein